MGNWDCFCGAKEGEACKCPSACNATDKMRQERDAALLQIDAMRPVVEAAIMWANTNNNVTDTVPWLERAVLAYKDATEKRSDAPLCCEQYSASKGSCPIHKVR